METYTIIDDKASQTKNWTLTGYSRENTDSGTLYTKLYQSAGNYCLELYSDAERTSENLVAQGNIANSKGKLTLAEANNSGLSGEVQIDYSQDAEFKLVAFYACYEDLSEVERNLDALLDENGKIAGRPRFEIFLEHAKKLIDVHVEVRFLRSGLSEPPTREQIKEPASLKTPAVYAALASLYWYLKSDFNDANFKQALTYERKLGDWLATQPIVFAREDTEIVLEASAVYLRRA